MTTFSIDHEFMLDGKPFKILSGAIHYFRVHPSDWYHSLYNLKALGFNTVETYVPWNLHEYREGEFDFSGILDIERFLKTAEDLGLYAIVRPSPYICAEWEFGGFPAWLLTKKMRLRTDDPAYLAAIDRYYTALMPHLVDHQVTHGGNVIMMQVENEYGSYGEDQDYLAAVAKLMQQHGVDVRAVIKRGSVNLYMFHGGTNFGFMNGTSARKDHDLPQVTSYDYDAPLNEQGNPTPKYFAIQKMIHEKLPEVQQAKPLVKPTMAPASHPLTAKVSLFAVLDQLAKPIAASYPQTQEFLGQYTGYTLYRTQPLISGTDKGTPAKLRVIDARDRVQAYLDQKWLATQYQEAIGDDILLPEVEGHHQLDLLVENMSRVNYGSKIEAITQFKGIRTGVMVDLHFIKGYQQYPLDLNRASRLTFTEGWQPATPAFYKYTFDLTAPQDTYLDCRGFGKGVMLVNGVNVGRFWEKGPTLSLYVPAGLLHAGKNDVIVFETEGRYAESLKMADHPIFKEP